MTIKGPCIAGGQLRFPAVSTDPRAYLSSFPSLPAFAATIVGLESGKALAATFASTAGGLSIVNFIFS
jgi:hypothetical protein